jgi:hypothetical protein
VSDPARDAIMAEEQEARRLILRSTLLKFIGQFDYATVRKELTEAKREHAEGLRRERALRKQAQIPGRDGQAARAHLAREMRLNLLGDGSGEFGDTIERLQHVFIAVETVRATRPGMTAKDACAELEKNGGIVTLASSDPRLGPGALLRSRIAGASTIEREFKRTQQLLRADRYPDGKPGEIKKVWQNMLADWLGRPRPFS